MNESEMIKNYTTLISNLNKRFHTMGEVWWYSLIHEKNPNKSKSIHNIIKKHYTPMHFKLFRAILMGVKKYLSYIVRYVMFNFTMGGRGQDYDCENLIVGYDDETLHPVFAYLDSKTKIILPQKSTWKETRYKGYRNNVLILDELLSISDFIIIPIKALLFMAKFLWSYDHKLRDELWIKGALLLRTPRLQKYLKMDTYRSFYGDVLIEGLFFSQLFKKVNKTFPKVKLIIYQYEGQAWEKALCIHLKGEKIGLICSAFSPNTLNYILTKNDLTLVPRPDRLGVIGGITKRSFEEVWGDKVFVAGTTRYNYLKNIGQINGEGKYNIVILGMEDEQALELIDFIVESGIKDTIFKPHPYSKLSRNYFVKNINWYLNRARCVITTDSSYALEAIARGVCVVIPKLKSFIPMDVIPKEGEDFVHRVEIPFLLKGLSITNNPVRKELCKEFINNYFSFCDGKTIGERIKNGHK